jgi:hypothetical protein
MNPEQINLANAIVLNKSFQWKIGMQGVWLVEYPCRYHRIVHNADALWVEGRAIPDLTDPATVGFLIYFLTDDGLKELVHQPLSLESFGTTVAKTLLADWNRV